jgi:cyclopropane-fatty-acyl-phospholipid synthase
MLVARVLRKLLKTGSLTLIDADSRRHEIRGAKPGPHATIRLTDKALHRRLLTNPYLAVGEAYMDGTLLIEEGTLENFLDVLLINEDAAGDMFAFRANAWWDRQLRWLQQYNPIGKARENVAHHYDLSDTLYDLFLDRDRQYSCAYFTADDETLEEAQNNKKRHLAAKLLLEPGQKVLDIGSGWGGLALYLARVANVDVTGLTLSVEQHKVATERARAAGLADSVRFHLRDYREDNGRYDRIVSVGMFEHVGARHYREFFRHLRNMLTEDGVCLLHSIGRMEPPGSTSPWLRKYIFPGGYTPALSETLAAVERERLYVCDIEILRLHYAKTLHRWYDRFQANRSRIEALYDARFCRMWEFYLKGCEVSFKYANQMVFQMQLARRQEAVPLTRDYITNFERARDARIDAAASGMAAE